MAYCAIWWITRNNELPLKIFLLTRCSCSLSNHIFSTNVDLRLTFRTYFLYSVSVGYYSFKCDIFKRRFNMCTLLNLFSHSLNLYRMAESKQNSDTSRCLKCCYFVLIRYSRTVASARWAKAFQKPLCRLARKLYLSNYVVLI